MAPRPRAPRPAGPAHRDRTPWQRVWDRVRATDPGWDRARTSARAVLAAGIGAGAAAGLATATAQPVRLAALAAVVGIFGGITLPPPAERPRHLLHVGWVFTTSALVTTLLSPWPLAARGALLAAIALGAWAGRWGQRGVGLGLLAFLGSFFALLFDAPPGNAATVVGAGLLGTAGLALAERVLLPDRPALLLRRLVRSLVSQASLMVDAAEALVAQGPGAGRQRRARSRLLSVQEVALLVDTTLEDPAAAASVVDPERLRSDVLVVEALADHLVWAVLSVAVDADEDQRADLVAAMARARVPMGVDVDRAVDALVPQLVGRGDDRVIEVLERLAAAVERLVHAARPTGTQPRPGPTRTAPATADPAPIGRTVVQATAAGLLALGLGALVDADQWYWAVVGAYIVVTTTSSRGTALRKAADRVVGTGLGVVVGLGLASLLAGRATVGLVVLLGLLFATFWVFRISYRGMMVLLTVTVAVLYELTGRLSVEVLALRLAETALGALVAGLVVFFVLPTPTRRTVDGAVDALLGALDDLLAAAADGHVDTGDVRHVDAAVSTLRATTAPLVTQAPTRIAGEVRAARLLATAVRVRAGALATAVATSGAPRPGAPGHDALRVVREHGARLRRHLTDPDAAVTAMDASPFPATDGEVGAVLQAIDDRLAGYGTARGLALRPDPGALAGGTPRWRD